MLIVAKIGCLAGSAENAFDNEDSKVNICVSVFTEQTVLIMSTVMSDHYVHLKSFFCSTKFKFLTTGVELKLLCNA